jgi:toxin ParE1/3/4
MFAQIESLSMFPRRCPPIPQTESLNSDVRHLIHGDYLIIFEIDHRCVLVLKVWHGAREPMWPPD